MRIFKLLPVLVGVSIGIASCQATKSTLSEKNSGERPYLKNSLIIYYDPQVGKEGLLKKIEEYGAVTKYQYRIINAVAVTLPHGKSLAGAEAYFKNVRGVVQVEKDYIQSANQTNTANAR